MKRPIYIVFLLFITSCNQPATSTNQPVTAGPGSRDTSAVVKDAADTLSESIVEKEQASANKNKTTDTLGGLVTTISFEVKTNDLKEYPGGTIPYASIEKADKDIPNLVNKDQVVIHDTTIRIIIDYPLNSPCTFRLSSPTGFTIAMLLKAISKHYYLVYKEEEETATIKTLPMNKRKIYNRNETNGKYGIWGHDIGDLVLDEAIAYRNDKGQVTLTLEIDS